jgi:ComF family protein
MALPMRKNRWTRHGFQVEDRFGPAEWQGQHVRCLQSLRDPSVRDGVVGMKSVPNPANAADSSWPPLFRQGRRAFRAMLGGLIGIVYPPSCIACHAAIAQAQALCPRCWSGIAFIERPFCERLGTPFAVDLGAGLLSPAAIADPPVFERARAVCRFEGTARDLVHRLKYGDRLELALTLGRMMVPAGAELLAQADLIVPVPLHRTRLWRRRFNQAAALAEVVATQSGRPNAPSALERRKRTRQQVGLTRSQRQENLQGAFIVPAHRKPLVEGRAILLIDDVLTTGATVNAAARALLKAGASRVDCLTFARVVTDG